MRTPQASFRSRSSPAAGRRSVPPTRGRREIPGRGPVPRPVHDGARAGRAAGRNHLAGAARRRRIRLRRARPARRRLRALHGRGSHPRTPTCASSSAPSLPYPDPARGRPRAPGRVGGGAGRAVGLDPRIARVPPPPRARPRRSRRRHARGSKPRDRGRRHRERPPLPRGRRAATAAVRLHPPPPRAHRHARRLRARRLRCMHRRLDGVSHSLVPAPRRAGRRLRAPHGRGPRRRPRAHAASGCVPPPSRAAVRLLHARDPDRGRRPALA